MVEGVDVKKSKWIVGILVLVLALSLVSLLAACGEDGKTTTTAAQQPTETTSGPETTAAPTTEPPSSEKPAKPVELKFSTSVGVKYSLWGAFLEPWYKSVEESSNGLISITAYPENTLVKEEQQYDALLDGTSDISVIVIDYNPGTFPVAEVSGLPMLFPDPGTASDVFYDIVHEYCQEELKDVQILGVTVMSANQYAGTKPVKVPADFKGLRMRSGAAVETDIINALGATPVEIPTGDLAVSMERGMADGTFLTWSFLFLTGAPNWGKHWTECDVFYRCFVIAMNKDKWESLAAEQQQAFLDNSTKEKCREYNLANDTLADGPKKSFMDMAQAPGKSFHTLTAEERAQWKAAMVPVYDKWVKNLPSGIDGQAILDRIEELVAAAKPGETTKPTAPEIKIVFTDLGNDVVEVMIEPMPGKLFNVSTEGPYAAGVEAFDADGKSLGPLEIPDETDGKLDYSGVPGIYKIVVIDKAHGNTVWEYIVP